VLKEDGEVRDHFYGSVCHPASGSAGTSCAVRATHHEHRSDSRERELAKVRLGDVDSGVIDRLRRESGVGNEVPIGLRGDRWVLGTFQRNGFVADLDGSHLHPARTPVEHELVRSVSLDPGVKRAE
jgi:hypothetical protein